MLSSNSQKREIQSSMLGFFFNELFFMPLWSKLDIILIYLMFTDVFIWFENTYSLYVLYALHKQTTGRPRGSVVNYNWMCSVKM